MIKSFFINSILAISIVLFFYGCANQMSPTGGPKDETPPILIDSNPKDRSLNFKENSVELTFNETIQVFNLKNELIISPTYSGEIDFKLRGNVVVVEFDPPFADSTTYTLNFRESIKDITEGNTATNLKLAFSTWHFMDSLQINGSVIDLFTGEPAQDFIVGIYVENDTLTPFNSPPLYFSKTDNTGNYSISNIKSDLYKLYAYQDKNGNLTIQSKSESYGYFIEPIKLDSTYNDQIIQVQNLDITELSIQSSRQNGQYYEIKATKYILDYELVNNTDDNQLISKYSDDHRGIIIYNTFPIADSLEVIVNLTDSLYLQSQDTIHLAYVESNRQYEDFTIEFESPILNRDKKLLTATVKFNKPVYTVNFDSLYIRWDSVRITPIDTSELHFGPSNLEVNITKYITEEDYSLYETNNEKPEMYSGLNTFTSIESDSSLNKTTFIKPIEAKNFGTIKGVVILDTSNYFIHLINSNYEIVRSLYNQTEYTFNYVPPGTYKVRLLIDSNNNGKWEPGNILTNTPPEPILYYTSDQNTTELILRANWELIDIDFNELLITVDIDKDNGG